MNRLEIHRHADGRTTASLNGTPLQGRVHITPGRDQHGQLLLVDVRLYECEIVDHGHPKPWP